MLLRMQYYLAATYHPHWGVGFQFGREVKMRQKLLVMIYLSRYVYDYNNTFYNVITYGCKYFYIEAHTGLSSLLWLAGPKNKKTI